MKRGGIEEEIAKGRKRHKIERKAREEKKKKKQEGNKKKGIQKI